MIFALDGLEAYLGVDDVNAFHDQAVKLGAEISKPPRTSPGEAQVRHAICGRPPVHAGPAITTLIDRAVARRPTRGKPQTTMSQRRVREMPPELPFRAPLTSRQSEFRPFTVVAGGPSALRAGTQSACMVSSNAGSPSALQPSSPHAPRSQGRPHKATGPTERASPLIGHLSRNQAPPASPRAAHMRWVGGDSATGYRASG